MASPAEGALPAIWFGMWCRRFGYCRTVPSREPPRAVRWVMVRQEWRKVAFVHWPVAADRLAALVPEPLSLDTRDGVAWLTLSPFSTTCQMFSTIPVPGPRRFPETNLRTYVEAPDGTDGLYFLSLDVTNRSNAGLGRLLRLPYHLGDMVIEEPTPESPYVRSAGVRRADRVAAYDVRLDVDAASTGGAGALDTYLTGRWSAYFHAVGRLFRCDVEHEPWPLRPAHLVSCHQTLDPGSGGRAGDDAVVHYAAGVSAKLSWPIPVTSG